MRCETEIISSGISFGRCGKAATGRYRVMCVHEHMREAFLCQDCMAEPPGWKLCRKCYYLGHNCPVEVKLLEAAGAQQV